MFMKHYAPNRCEPSIEALHFFFGGGGEGGVGGIRADVNGEVKLSVKFRKKNIFFFLGGGGGGGGGGSG